MDNKSLKNYRDILNKKKASSTYITSYEDNILINEKLKYFFRLESDEISLLNLYRKINEIKLDSQLCELENILNLREYERTNKLYIYLKLNEYLFKIK